MDETLAFDSISPQSELVDRAAGRLAADLEAMGPAGLAAAPDALASRVRALADAQPAMAALVALGTRVLLVDRKAVKEEATPAERHRRVVEALAAWRADWRAAGDAVVRQAQAVLPSSGWVATTTRSSLVERALLAAHAAGASLRVLCSESRPMNEGRMLAARLAEAGVPVWQAVDGALPLLLPQAGAVWVGADAVRERTFVSKAGTWALLLAARELNVPVWALAQRAKFLPGRCRRLTLPQRAPVEVWDGAPAGVHVVNLPFEEVPLALVRGVITESGVLGAREAEDAAAGSQVAAELLEPAAPGAAPGAGATAG